MPYRLRNPYDAPVRDDTDGRRSRPRPTAARLLALGGIGVGAAGLQLVGAGVAHADGPDVSSQQAADPSPPADATVPTWDGTMPTQDGTVPTYDGQEGYAPELDPDFIGHYPADVLLSWPDLPSHAAQSGPKRPVSHDPHLSWNAQPVHTSVTDKKEVVEWYYSGMARVTSADGLTERMEWTDGTVSPEVPVGTLEDPVPSSNPPSPVIDPRAGDATGPDDSDAPDSDAWHPENSDAPDSDATNPEDSDAPDSDATNPEDSDAPDSDATNPDDFGSDASDR